MSRIFIALFILAIAAGCKSKLEASPMHPNWDAESIALELWK